MSGFEYDVEMFQMICNSWAVRQCQGKSVRSENEDPNRCNPVFMQEVSSYKSESSCAAL